MVEYRKKSNKIRYWFFWTFFALTQEITDVKASVIIKCVFSKISVPWTRRKLSWSFGTDGLYLRPLILHIFCIHFCNFKRKSKVASTLARYKIVSVWKFEQQLLIQKLRKIALKLACDSARFLRSSMWSQKQPKCLGEILRLWNSFKKLLPLGHGFFFRGLVSNIIFL